jgi:cell division protein ZipA
MDQLDSETLRWLLAAVGAAVIVVVYVWGRYKAKLLDMWSQRGEASDDDSEPSPGPIRTSGGLAAIVNKKKKEEAPPVAEDNFEDNEYFTLDDDTASSTEPAPAERTASLGAPFLVQISVVANEGEYFNGLDLRDTLEELKLIYGDMGIYHRYDRDYREPLFSVATLVEPGTFPIKDLENFDCPGIVLFFQPPRVDDPIAVFDDLVTTCHQLAIQLDGLEWDEKRQPLTQDKIAKMRARLKEAY